MKLILLFLGCIFFGIFASLIYGAHWAFYLYELVYFFHPENRWWGQLIPSLGYSKMSVLIMIATFFLHKKKYNNKITDIPVLSWAIALLVLMGVTSFYAVWREIHYTALTEYYKMFIVMTFAYKTLDNSSRLQGSVFAYLFGATYIGYEAFSTGRNSGDRVEGIGLIDATDANLLAATLVPAIPLIVFYFWFTTGWIRIMTLISGAFVVNAFILINSRGAMLGAVTALIYFFSYYLMSNVKTKHHYKKLFFFSLAGLLALLTVVDTYFIERMATLINAESKEASGAGRIDLWLITFDMVRDYPFGAGAKGYNALSTFYVPEEVRKGYLVKSVHSLWFQVLAELGWIGLFVFSMFIYKIHSAMKKVIRNSSDSYYEYYFSIALLSGFVGLILTSSFIDQFRNQIIYIIITLLMALHSILKNGKGIRKFNYKELK